MRTAGEEGTGIEGSYRDSKAGVGAFPLLSPRHRWQKETRNVDHNPGRRAVHLSDRFRSRVAAQQGLGILPKRRTWSRSPDHSCTLPHGPALVSNNLVFLA